MVVTLLSGSSSVLTLEPKGLKHKHIFQNHVNRFVTKSWSLLLNRLSIKLWLSHHLSPILLKVQDNRMSEWLCDFWFEPWILNHFLISFLFIATVCIPVILILSILSILPTGWLTYLIIKSCDLWYLCVLFVWFQFEIECLDFEKMSSWTIILRKLISNSNMTLNFSQYFKTFFHLSQLFPLKPLVLQ